MIKRDVWKEILLEGNGWIEKWTSSLKRLALSSVPSALDDIQSNENNIYRPMSFIMLDLLPALFRVDTWLGPQNYAVQWQRILAIRRKSISQWIFSQYSEHHTDNSASGSH